MLMGYDLATGDREVEMHDFYIPLPHKARQV